MTYLKLLELCKKISENKINGYQISQLKYFTDEEIDLILNSKHQREVQNLIENKYFRSQPIEIQKSIIEIIDTYESNEDSIFFAIQAATNKNAINCSYIIEIVKIIIQLKEKEKMHQILGIAQNYVACSNKDVLEIIKMIAESQKTKEILEYAVFSVKNEFIYKTGRTLEIVKSILNTDDEKQAEQIFMSELKEGLQLNLLDSLDNETLDEVDFWNLFFENNELAAKILTLAANPGIIKNVSQEEIESLGLTEFVKELTELKNKYILENSQDNSLYDSNSNPKISSFTEIPAHIRIRKKSK